MNPLGLVAAVTTFLCIWIGHVTVRKVEAISPHIWKPVLLFILFGLAGGILALITVDRQWSTTFGIAGITLLWDAFELTRQQKRVIRGHAPANPKNPRHSKILAKYSSATTLELLKREPMGELLHAGPK